MHEFCEQGSWTVLPLADAMTLPDLHLSPLGVVPQRDRRPRPIVDYTFSGVNDETVRLAPGKALQRILNKVVHAHPVYGPVYLAKIDIADGFYPFEYQWASPKAHPLEALADTPPAVSPTSSTMPTTSGGEAHGLARTDKRHRQRVLRTALHAIDQVLRPSMHPTALVARSPSPSRNCAKATRPGPLIRLSLAGTSTPSPPHSTYLGIASHASTHFLTRSPLHAVESPPPNGTSFWANCVRWSRPSLARAASSLHSRRPSVAATAIAYAFDSLADFRAIADTLRDRPTRFRELIPVGPTFARGACDACQRALTDGHGRSGHPTLCPVHALTRRIPQLRHILQLRHAGAAPTTPLNAFRFAGPEWHFVLASDITAQMRRAAATLPTQDLDTRDFTARCTRAGGAMALLCGGFVSDRIRLIGRWRSDEVYRYVHVQAQPVMTGAAAAMLRGGNFRLNIPPSLPGVPPEGPPFLNLRPTGPVRRHPVHE
ncbi:hypothetical protein MHU86_10039 [Fragilaria crotonensis]|nr:hypothetical protein MHU86_10039 [Fragilaria crotonensis]